MKKYLIIIISLLFLTGCENKKEEEKINLNVNVYYYTDVELTDNTCGGFAFIESGLDSIDEEFITKYDSFNAVDKIALNESNDIVYDSKKEEEVKKLWDNLKAPSRGVSDVNISYTDHEFNFSYWYITLVKDSSGNFFKPEDKYYKIAVNIGEEVANFKSEALNIISNNGGYRLLGTCGGPSYEIKLLDEDTCNKFNLNCGRW